MIHLAKSLLPLAILVVPALAEIDSGGGPSSGGATVNHSSIGEPFATLTTQGGTTSNRPGLIEVLYPTPAGAGVDSDGNSLPDAWELANFGTLGVDPAADPDHDGTSNRMEYLAGTNPNNATSVFRPQGTYTAGIFRLPLATVVGRSYKIWLTRDMKTWTHYQTLTGDGGQQVFAFDETTVGSGPLHSTTHPSAYYFRVEILIP